MKIKGAFFWSFLPIGGMVVWLVPFMSQWQLMSCVLLYGFFMMFAGMMVGLAHTREQGTRRAVEVENEVKKVKENALRVAMRAASTCSDVVALSVAERMVDELVVHQENDEEMAAAKNTALRVAEEESRRVKSQIGADSENKDSKT